MRDEAIRHASTGEVPLTRRAAREALTTSSALVEEAVRTSPSPSLGGIWVKFAQSESPLAQAPSDVEEPEVVDEPAAPAVEDEPTAAEDGSPAVEREAPADVEPPSPLEPVPPDADSSRAPAEPALIPAPEVPAPAPTSRRAARAAELIADESAASAHHRRPRRLPRLAVVAGLAVGGALLLGSSAAMTAMLTPPRAAMGAAADASPSREAQLAAPAPAETLPVPEIDQQPVVADICTIPDFAAALTRGDDEAAVLAAGGGEAFRAAVAEGRAPCVDLRETWRVWAVVNKVRPATPLDYRPTGLVLPDGVRNIEGGALRSDAASALTSLVAAARDAGVGEVALESAFRSFQTQQETYSRHYAERGEQADQVSARPGHSEHQLGLSADVVACSGGCGTLDDLAATAQGQWLAAHAWELGWIVRYAEGATEVTGYVHEPWHLRYVGRELARAYHDGGWRSLEEFFGLEAAPGYLG